VKPVSAKAGRRTKDRAANVKAASAVKVVERRRSKAVNVRVVSGVNIAGKAAGKRLLAVGSVEAAAFLGTVLL